MKSFIAAALFAASASAQECDSMCAMIYSVDPVTCMCVPISWMECHPQYNPAPDCNQRDVDTSMGRDWMANPYMGDYWYSDSEDDNDVGEWMNGIVMGDGATGVFASAASIMAVFLAILA